MAGVTDMSLCAMLKPLLLILPSRWKHRSSPRQEDPETPATSTTTKRSPCASRLQKSVPRSLLTSEEGCVLLLLHLLLLLLLLLRVADDDSTMADGMTAAAAQQIQPLLMLLLSAGRTSNMALKCLIIV